ncbi:MAG: hypothetical protein KDD32_11065 [Bacteroidetes bacterium]|nr:hypothetical protein [Bacteroidota bacterium]
MSESIERIQITSCSANFRIKVYIGKQGDYWGFVAPSINISGYGHSKKEARDSFEHNIDVFGDDLFELTVKERITVLKELGWEQHKFFQKRFSKCYVDENGVLQNFDQDYEVQVLEEEFA